ncbi:YesL family protein [Agromyces albus]|uniref:YesL family protein n=1 Tax=Agromyces albus TaxID=205332 RepID=UPI0013E919AE|nr:YesL family protein [Agromyces albus]
MGTDADQRASIDRRPKSGIARVLAPSRETFENVFDTVYQALAIAFSVAVAGVPLVAALTVVAQPLAAWPFLLLCAVPLGPAITAAFSCFERARRTGDLRPMRDFWIAYAGTARRALGVWVATLVLGAILVLDVMFLWGTEFAALVGPLLAVVGALLVVTALGSFAGIARHPESRVRDILKAALFLAVRRWPVSLVTLAILGAWATIILAQPVVGVLGLGGFALYLLWSNSAAGYASLTRESEATPTTR